ncbi:MAG: phospholipase D-like domain-containing protein [Candidatus Woesearchaeota archaeon]
MLVLLLCLFSLTITSNLYGKQYDEKQYPTYGRNEKKPIYFLDNISIYAYFCPRDNCSEILINMLKGSSSIRCLFYDFNLENISEILKTKNDYFVGVYIKNLKSEYYGITHINTSSVMHNKYCILDENVVITGSMNPTYRDAYLNNNNLIVIKSRIAAEFYLNDFLSIINMSDFNAPKEPKENGERSKISGILKNSSYVEIKNPSNNISLRICFSPFQNCRNLILETLKKSKESIYFMTFSFTDNSIAERIAEKIKEGILAEGIIEKKFYSRSPEVIRGILFNDTNPYNLHHKVFIIDKNIVITGSFNPSYNALSNFENLVVIENSQIAKSFAEEFFMLKKKSS